MCETVLYCHDGREWRLAFATAHAQLPVRIRCGDVELLPWGRRQHQQGQLPLGGWARLEGIYAGHWDRWFPQPVKLPLLSFMEKDIEGQARWYDITAGKWVQGLVARDGHERRVYVVTVEPRVEDAIHTRWPRILCG